jgi:cellulose synthase/poly-beta-1,6-N-acetylglucosamine synthase-like glycosyltransferase
MARWDISLRLIHRCPVSDPRLLLSNPQSIVGPNSSRFLGRQLVDDGHISASDLVHALDLQSKVDARLGEILIAEGLIGKNTLLDALAIQSNAQRVDLKRDIPRLQMAEALPASVCLQYEVVPWLWIGNTLLVATSHPAQFEQLRTSMGKTQLSMLPVIADPNRIRGQITRLYGYQLVQKAITQVPSRESCRSWGKSNILKSKWTIGLGTSAIIGILMFPYWALTLAALWAALTLTLTVGIKGVGFIAQILSKTPETSPQLAPQTAQFRLPRVSVMVPLLHEQEIAGALIKRLEKLTYPKSLLDIVLVLEATDEVTRATLARTDLPSWITVIEVPDADGLTTKPRALNYALDFCRGSIIGVWDAEDAPEPDQIEKVVTRFNEAPENVVCLQGILDYYNPKENWISRCFTIEYATWWRLVLPGIAKLGLVLPLGGTTLFFKREPLEKLGRWDAHNVTEDADLGVRLARHGYVTELIPTVTYEEANCRPWRWVRQRSRWLKGFMITYVVHMRDPIQLIRDLGFMRFMGVQMIFLATFSQFALAPVLWSFWVTFFGISHPVHTILGDTATTALIVLFFTSELLNITMAMVAVSGQHHRHLMKWVLTTPLYFTLGALAAYKAIYEMIVTPFYWDKTQHGMTKEQ